MNSPRAAAVAICAAAAPFLLAAGVAVAAETSGTLSDAGGSDPTASCLVLNATPAGTHSLGTAQISNARIIYDVAVSLSLPAQAPVIGIATAMQESRLENLPYGDRDSLGLFQQRPSQGWGTPTQIMNPVYAAKAFYDALIRVPGWQQLPVDVAAQDVQHSADPGAYAQWQTLANTLVSKFSGSAVSCSTGTSRDVPASGSVRLPASYTIPAGVPMPIQVAIAYAIAQLGKPYVWGGTGPDGYDCSGLVMMAYRAGGVDLPRTTFQQVLVGTSVSGIGDLQPGDLLFSAGSDGTASNPGHVGMYIGDGLVIEAAETGKPIMLTPVAGYWQTSTVAIRRMV